MCIILLRPIGEDSGEVYLNYHDCIGRLGGWYQNSLRNPKLDSITRTESDGYWPVDVQSAGKYRIELRRWPKEVDAAIHVNVPPGAPVYGKKEIRSVPGKGFNATKTILVFGDKTFEADVASSDKVAVFDVMLEKGNAKLSAYFCDIPGEKRLDTFYVYVRQLDTSNN